MAKPGSMREKGPLAGATEEEMEKALAEMKPEQPILEIAAEKEPTAKEMSVPEIKTEIRILAGRLGHLKEQKEKKLGWGILPKSAIDKLDTEIGAVTAKLGSLRQEMHFGGLTDQEIDAAVENIHFEPEEKYMVRIPAERDKFETGPKEPSEETKAAMKEALEMSAPKEEKMPDLDITVGEEPDMFDVAMLRTRPEAKKEKPLAETPAEKEFFEKGPDYSAMDEEGVISHEKLSPEEQMKADEDRLADLDKAMTDTRERMKAKGLDLDEALEQKAVSRWASFKLGIKSLFNREAGRALKEYGAMMNKRGDLYEEVTLDKFRLSNPKAYEETMGKRAERAGTLYNDTARRSAKESEPHTMGTMKF